MVGAIPFDTCQPSELYIPERWEAFSRGKAAFRPLCRAAGGDGGGGASGDPGAGRVFSHGGTRRRADRHPEVDKVVLSRLIDITTRDRVDSGALMERLIAQNPASFNFHVPLSDGGVLLRRQPGAAAA